jgi:hypothetical protein
MYSYTFEGKDLKSKSNLSYDRQSVGRSVLVSETYCRPRLIYISLQRKFSLDICSVLLWSALSDEGPGLYFSVQSLYSQSLITLITALYCLNGVSVSVRVISQPTVSQYILVSGTV